MTIRRALLLLVIALGVGAPIVARADDYVGTTTTTATTSSTTVTTLSGPTTTIAPLTSSTIEGAVFTQPTQPTQPSVLGEQVRKPAVSGLALTGTDILGITALAAALLAVGLGLVIRARRPVA
jgi:hypothetical protein